ncbi:MAG: TIGR00341 family protein [Campylobacterales bacterium]|nr:TIGR00341 family protein [Campylobacterales bacterium]
MDTLYIVTTKEKEQTLHFQELLQLIKIHYKRSYAIKYYTDIITQYDENTLVLLYLGEDKIRVFIKNHLTSSLNIAILPLKNNKKVQLSYGISSDLYEALEDALNKKSLHPMDLLLCNGEPVFSNIVIGDVHELNNAALEKLSLLKKIKKSIQDLYRLSFQDFTITTAKEQKIRTAATGIMVFEHNSKQSDSSMINEDLSLHDGQLNALILAPSSILSYIYYLFLVYIYNHFSMKKLPKSIGVIKTSKLTIESKAPIDYKIDGLILSTKAIEMEVLKDQLNISIGRYLKPIVSNKQQEPKESVKVQYLPKGELRQLLLFKKIPFFKKADEDDFKELFLSLRESANLSSVFLILMILSTLLATTGLFQSSAPVIIGAMILAPLMSPIVSLSMGVVRAESELIKSSSKTLGYGVVTALFFSCLYTYLMPLTHITPEIEARLNPNILDLMVAIFSGIAGAYANAKSEVAKSLAGVAIAVALVPPLSVTGIGIGWGDTHIIYGSFLLFVTNLVGITLSAAITFIILGYAPIQRAKKGLFYTTAILTTVAIPLILSFGKLIEQNKIAKMIQPHYTINRKNIEVNILDIDLSEQKPIIKLESLSQEVLSKEDLYALKKEFEATIQKSVVLKVHPKVIVE